jgi:uncharacterized membrane protein
MKDSYSSGDDFVMTTHRIENLSDSIFAFSMTLLVMNFTFPAVGLLFSDKQVTEFFLKEIYKFDRYVLTFVLLAILWINHHRQFHHIKRADRQFLWIQIVILLFIVMVPFTAAWMSAYSHLHITNFVFDLNLFILSCLFLVSWIYATHKRRLVEENIDNRYVRSGVIRPIIGCFAALVAMVAAFFHPGWSNYAFILTPVLMMVVPLDKKRKASQ